VEHFTSATYKDLYTWTAIKNLLRANALAYFGTKSLTNKIIFITLITGVYVVKLALLLNKLKHLFLSSFLLTQGFRTKSEPVKVEHFTGAT
jgi:hypothetical protein